MNMKELKIVNDMGKGWREGKEQPLWHKKIYYMWFSMWNRCRNPNHPSYQNYKDCKIYNDFRYLSKYVEWIISEPNFKEFCETCDKVMWCIDKDIKDPNNRNYYPEYMTLTTQSKNCNERINRRGTTKPKVPVIAIDGFKVLLFKSTKDAQNKGFNQGAISECINKKRKIHKRYKWYKVNYSHNLRLRTDNLN